MVSLFTLIEEDGGVKIAQFAQLVIQFFQSFVSSAVFRLVFKYEQFSKDIEPFLPDI